jgi:hypothetical protein
VIPPITPPPLLSILLVTKTRSGPRLLLHYPPPSRDGQYTMAAKHRHSSASTASATSTTATESSSDSGHSARDVGTVVRGRRPSVSHSTSGASNTDPASERARRRRKRRASGGLLARITGDEEGALPVSSDDDVSEEDRVDRRRVSGVGGLGHAVPGRNGTTGPSTGTHTTSTGNRGDLNSQADKARRRWDVVLGHSLPGLAKLLAPTNRAWHKKRFEVSIEGMVFLGCPVFAKDEGGWGKRKRKTRKVHEEPTDGVRKEDDMGGKVAESDEADDENDGGGDIIHVDTAGHGSDYDTRSRTTNEEEISPTNTRSHAPLPIPQPTSLQSSGSDPASFGSSTGATPQPEALTMFNVVFVLTPSPLSHQSHIAPLYTHILTKLTAALKDRQKRNDYVWAESRKIIQLREKARNSGAEYTKTLPFILHASTLAAALAEVYDSLVAARIAHLSLDGAVQLSLQIPHPFSTSAIPAGGAQGGDLWLTSFDAFAIEESSSQTDVHKSGAISPHSALLLLVSPASLLKEIQVAKHMAPALAKALTLYLQYTTPTKSLQQLSKKLRLSLADLQLLSLHLIHWRRARPTPPLHASHIYVVSPLADFRKLPQASQAFSSTFATLPSLIALLGKLSSAVTRGPLPWASLIPSSDHKAPYMEMLEWLVRGGWVTQLRTFAWVLVKPEIKAEVARQVRQEERERDAALAVAATVEEDEYEDEDVDELGQAHPSDTDLIRRRRQSSFGSSAGPASLLSPRLRPHRALLHSSPRRRTSEAGSTSSTQTAVRMPLGKSKLEVSPLRISRNSSANTHSRHRLSSSSIQSRTPLADLDETSIDAADFEPSIVISPHKADALASRWLEYIGASLPDPELRDAWPKLLRYFDGKVAIEEITLREGMKRKVINPIMSRLIELGVLRIARHW